MVPNKEPMSIKLGKKTLAVAHIGKYVQGY